MISRTALQTIWQANVVDSTLIQDATHYSCSVSDEHSVFVLKHRSEEQADYLLVVDLLTNKTW
jgi:hypothetical protein